MAAGHVVQRSQVVGSLFEVPTAVDEDAIVGKGGDGFTNEQIVGFLVVQLGHDAESDPGGTAFEQGHVIFGKRHKPGTAFLKLARIAFLLTVPRLMTIGAMAAVGIIKAKKPLFSMSLRV